MLSTEFALHGREAREAQPIVYKEQYRVTIMWGSEYMRVHKPCYVLRPRRCADVLFPLLVFY